MNVNTMIEKMSQTGK